MFGALYWLHKRCIVFRFYSINCQNYHSLTYLYQVNQWPKTLLVLFQSAHFYCSLWKVEFARENMYQTFELHKHLGKNGAEKLPRYFCVLQLIRVKRPFLYCLLFFILSMRKKTAFKTNRVLGTIQYGLHCKKMICSRGVVSRAWVFANQKMSGRVMMVTHCRHGSSFSAIL